MKKFVFVLWDVGMFYLAFYVGSITTNFLFHFQDEWWFFPTWLLVELANMFIFFILGIIPWAFNDR